MRRREAILQELNENCVGFSEVRELEPLIDRLKDARVVFLGESTHGTQEFYEWRRLISEWLIVKQGFRFLAVEGDWPPCRRLDNYVRKGEGQSARHTLETFHRWPTWMWANTEITRLGEWLRSHNERLPEEDRAGFFGLDVYSLFESMESVVNDLARINPFLARMARHRYGCFDPFLRDERSYVRSLIDFPEGCEEQVVRTLQELLAVRLKEPSELQFALFDATQNARIVKNAEEYYRTIIHGNEDSWNVRDRHMMETLNLLLGHHGPKSKAIVWAHNTHIGDYRATDMALMGQLNLGGLAREQFGPEKVALVGFGTYRGQTLASHAWDGPIQRLPVPPAKPGSYDDLFHSATGELGSPNWFLLLSHGAGHSPLAEVRGQRAIGVVYDPAHERVGNYVPTSLSQRYDAFLFFDETRELEPLILPFERGEIPETWPSGG